MKTVPESRKQTCIFAGLSGILGIVMLIISFNINPGPPAGANINQLIAFSQRYYDSILWGAWLQAVAPVLITFFAFALVHLSGAANRLSGWMVFFALVVLMVVSLIEITFYIAVMFRSSSEGTLISLNTIYAVQHLYFIVAAPAVFLTLGIMLLNSGVMSNVFAYTAIVLGLAFAALGVLFLTTLVLPLWVTACGGAQAAWWLAASISLIKRSSKISVQSN
jgi:hypothetical protein